MSYRQGYDEISTCSGKWLGAYAGGTISGSSEFEKRCVGLALLPKAGLTIGLAFLVREALPEIGELLFNLLLASTVINMLLTPPLAKHTVSKLVSHNAVMRP
jgi:hypothetical protein